MMVLPPPRCPKQRVVAQRIRNATGTCPLRTWDTVTALRMGHRYECPALLRWGAPGIDSLVVWPRGCVATSDGTVMSFAERTTASGTRSAASAGGSWTFQTCRRRRPFSAPSRSVLSRLSLRGRLGRQRRCDRCRPSVRQAARPRHGLAWRGASFRNVSSTWPGQLDRWASPNGVRHEEDSGDERAFRSLLFLVLFVECPTLVESGHARELQAVRRVGGTLSQS